MPFDKPLFERVWTKEEDFPTFVSNEAQVRADMQYHPDALLQFLHQLIGQLEDSSAAGILGAKTGEKSETVQMVLDEHNEQINIIIEDLATLAAGGVPSEHRCSSVSFTALSWSANADGTVSLTVPHESHKRDRSAFGYLIYHKVGDVYKSGTWGAATTRVTYDDESRGITLTADTAYEGKIVFFGL